MDQHELQETLILVCSLDSFCSQPKRQTHTHILVILSDSPEYLWEMFPERNWKTKVAIFSVFCMFFYQKHF